MPDGTLKTWQKSNSIAGLLLLVYHSSKSPGPVAHTKHEWQYSCLSSSFLAHSLEKERPIATLLDY